MYDLQFITTLEALCLHPERNSSSILRADILHDSHHAQTKPSNDKTNDNHLHSAEESSSSTFNAPNGFIEHRRIRRRLLPKKPALDKALEQTCLFFTSPEHDTTCRNGIVCLLPEVKSKADVPYYHPILRKLVFRYQSSPSFTFSDDKDTVPQGKISIAALPFGPDDQEASENDSMGSRMEKLSLTANEALPQRTIRTCMHLLETLYKHGWGGGRGYEKRVIHDVSLTANLCLK